MKSGAPEIQIPTCPTLISWPVRLNPLPWRCYLLTPSSADEDHRYVKYDTSVTVSQSAYLYDACTNNRNSDNENPTIVTEFCLSPPDDVQWTSGWEYVIFLSSFSYLEPPHSHICPRVVFLIKQRLTLTLNSPSTQQTFYADWFAAQINAYEADTLGWIFWTWKSQLGDYRWSYQDAVAAGVIPTNLNDAYFNCASV